MTEPFQRASRINSLLKKEVSYILQREAEIDKNILITISEIQTSPNLIEARVYVSIIPEEKEKESFKALEKNIFHIQKAINKRLKIRPVPKIKFVLDHSIKEAGDIEEILNKI